MALFLVQHGISLAKDEDPKKGLSQKGKENSNTIAGVAKSYNIPVDEICHSGKTRAEQTAEIFNDFLVPERGMSVIQGIKPMDDVRQFANTLDVSLNQMVVGHLPFMERLTSFLTCGSDDIRVYKFQNAGIVCLDKDEGGDWYIKWSLSPDIS